MNSHNSLKFHSWKKAPSARSSMKFCRNFKINNLVNPWNEDHPIFENWFLFNSLKDRGKLMIYSECKNNFSFHTYSVFKEPKCLNISSFSSDNLLRFSFKSDSVASPIKLPFSIFVIALWFRFLKIELNMIEKNPLMNKRINN